MKKNILKGTFLLSCASIITRIIGFYYKIFLVGIIGATGIGIYQMIFPVYGICISFSVAGIQMAISKFTAERNGIGDNDGMYTVLKAGLFISLVFSILSSIILYNFSNIIAVTFLDNADCSVLLKILAFAIPFSSIHACIGCYYLGRNKPMVFAISQLTEQVIRVFSVYVMAKAIIETGKNLSPKIAVLGLLFGELAASCLCLCILLCGKIKFKKNKCFLQHLKSILAMSTPISFNRIIVNFLISFEAVLIPLSLKKYGYSAENAIALYGILNGMALPFILFPSTITNSVSSMLLPSVSENQAKGDFSAIRRTAEKVKKYSLIIGVLSTAFFLFSGKYIGNYIYHNSDAGFFISVLSWLCPFIYVSSTLSSILNGMGKTNITFFISITSISFRILFAMFVVPIYGIYGFLIGLLVSDIVNAMLNSIFLKITLKREFQK